MRKKTAMLLLFVAVLLNSFSQPVKDDLSAGLYQSTPDWIGVYQMVSDSLVTFKLTASRHHFNKVAFILMDSIPDIETADPNEMRKRGTKIDTFLQGNNGRLFAVSKQEQFYYVACFTRKDTGYEIFTKKYKAGAKALFKSILRDTVDYFRFSVFTYDDLQQLKQMKKFDSITRGDFDKLLAYIAKQRPKYSKQIRNSDAESMYPTTVSNEILVKALLYMKYNPITMPGDFDRIYRKYKGNK